MKEMLKKSAFLLSILLIITIFYLFTVNIDKVITDYKDEVRQVPFSFEEGNINSSHKMGKDILSNLLEKNRMESLKDTDKENKMKSKTMEKLTQVVKVNNQNENLEINSLSLIRDKELGDITFLNLWSGDNGATIMYTEDEKNIYLLENYIYTSINHEEEILAKEKQDTIVIEAKKFLNDTSIDTLQNFNPEAVYLSNYSNIYVLDDSKNKMTVYYDISSMKVKGFILGF